MRIGEVSEFTGVPARLLRYYEEQGLLQPVRADNGYRHYPPEQVDRVSQIRALLDAGLPVRIIRDILPSLVHPSEIHVPDATPELIRTLEREREAMDSRIRCLVRNRDGITAYLDLIRNVRTASAEVADPAAAADQVNRCNPSDGRTSKLTGDV